MGLLKVFKKDKNNINVLTFYTNFDTSINNEELYKEYKKLESSKIGSIQVYDENDFLKTIDLTNLSSDVGFMSPAVRYIDLANRFIVFESVPTYKKISVSNVSRANVREANTKTYNIAVPWQIYLAYFDVKMNLIHLKAYYSKGPIENFNHKLYSIPLYNVYGNGRICLPKHGLKKSDKKKDYSELIVNSIQDFWMGSFNTDLWDNLNHSSIRKLWDSNQKFLKELGFVALDHSNIYEIFNSITLDEVMEFNFNSYLRLDQIVPINLRNAVNNSTIIQQLSLRNC